MSPTLCRVGPYRFFFFSNEEGEPAHVHIQEGRNLAKFWLQPCTLASSKGFAAHELKRLIELVRERQSEILEAWDEHFGG